MSIRDRTRDIVKLNLVSHLRERPEAGSLNHGLRFSLASSKGIEILHTSRRGHTPFMRSDGGDAQHRIDYA